MPSFRKRITEVKAEQFNINNKSPFGMVFIPVSIVYSADETCYYIRDGNHRSTSWVAVNKSEDGKYETWPFNFWKIKGGKVVGIEDWMLEENDLYSRYIQAEGWEEGSLPYGYLESSGGGRIAVYYYDWLVNDGEKVIVVKPDVFKADYELSTEEGK